MEPWEALDLDDSDLPSILRPCKRHLSQQSQISLSNPNFSSQNCDPLPPADNHPPPSRCLIPGPAGALQAVMDRLGRTNQDFSDANISTQDYIKMAEEDDAEEFTTDSWLSAMDFLTRQGGRRSTSLNDIKNCVGTEKIDMVVALIKCCTPNGLGDMMVVLKDPTSTINASIHRKVLTEGDNGKQIVVGSVLILQQVSIFSSLHKSCYLNISLSNVVKIVPKDAVREIYSEYTAEYDASECNKNLKMPEQVLSGSGRTAKASQLNINHVREENLASGNQIIDDQNSNIYASLQHRLTRDRAVSNIMKKPIEVDLVSLNQDGGTEKVASISGNTQTDTDLRDEIIAENLGDEHLFENLVEDLGNEKSVETQQVKQNSAGVERLDGHAGTTPSKASFQQWTDDQLDILDMDD